MSDIKRGDRVKVEFEALADETYADVAYIITPFAKMPLKIHNGYLTKIHKPLPTKVGAVIRHPADGRVRTLGMMPGSHSAALLWRDEYGFRSDVHTPTEWEVLFEGIE